MLAKRDTSKTDDRDAGKWVVGEHSLIAFHLLPPLQLNVSLLVGVGAPDTSNILYTFFSPNDCILLSVSQ